jgi:carboxymethylenebutenolidase
MNITTGMVEFAGNGSPLPGYLAQPEGEGTHPGVVVIQEWWGLNDHIKDVTERFARAGYVALAPDLYRGEVAAEPDDARRLAMALERPKAIVDIQGAVDYLHGLPQVAPKKIGVIGFCMGGGLAMMMSFMGEKLGAVVVFYGGGIKMDDENAPQVSAPVLGIFGELDGGIPVDQVRANESKLKEYGKTVEFHVYPNAPHAFFNDTRPHIYKHEAAEDAWEKTLAWFSKYLV